MVSFEPMFMLTLLADPKAPGSSPLRHQKTLVMRFSNSTAMTGKVASLKCEKIATQTQWVVVEVEATVAEAVLEVDSELEEDSAVVVDLADAELMAVALEDEAVDMAVDLPGFLLLQALQVARKRRTHPTRLPTSQLLVARRIRSSTCET